VSTKSAVSFLQVVTIANPVAGAEFTIKAPGQGLWRVVSVAFTFTASAAAANRRVALLADDQTDTWFAAASSVDLTAGLTTRIGAYAGATASGVVGGAVSIPLPHNGLVLMPGYRLRSSAFNLDVGDQYSNVRAQVQEYPYGPDFEWLPTVPVQIAEME
jgi:hypothetical protein